MSSCFQLLFFVTIFYLKFLVYHVLFDILFY
nr:MAG TPA_asm: hypothetical protein [Bacteriophage sp.]